MRPSPVIALALVAAVAGLAACGGGGSESTRVYFIDGYKSEVGMRGRLIWQERSLAEPGLGRVVAEVLRGPTASERDERGLITAFPTNVRVSTVALVNGTAKLSLASETPPRRWPDEFYATAQLVYTVTALPGVERLVVTVNGRRCCAYDMRQRPWAKPLTRQLFANWQGAPLDP
jgi:hypothetical protein